MLYNKVCAICQKDFETHQPRGRYCPECRGNGCKNKAAARYWRWKHSHPCPDCSQTIAHNSHRCIKCAHTKTGREHRGANNARWKGGKTYDCDGYVRVIHKGHARTRNGYVYQHILVWEEANGILPHGYIIHHLNGIKNDNRLCNLAAMPKSQHHYAIHLHSLQRRIRDLEAEISQQTLF